MAAGVLVRIGRGVSDERITGRRKRGLGAAHGVGGAGRRLEPLHGHQPGPQGEGKDEREEGGAALRVERAARSGSSPGPVRSGCAGSASRRRRRLASGNPVITCNRFSPF